MQKAGFLITRLISPLLFACHKSDFFMTQLIFIFSLVAVPETKLRRLLRSPLPNTPALQRKMKRHQRRERQRRDILIGYFISCCIIYVQSNLNKRPPILKDFSHILAMLSPLTFNETPLSRSPFYDVLFQV